MTETQYPRPIRSFVLRTGRITDAQERALETLWPRYGLEPASTLLDLDELFGRHAHRTAEIGFGNGENLVALAARHPERDFLGIEVHRPGVGRLLLAAEAARITNLKVLCHDAVEVLSRQISPSSLNEILVLFPDPWPKKRHHKRRLIQPAFVELLAQRLAAGGLLRLATDWQPYAEQMLEVLNACTLLENLSSDATAVPRPDERIVTRFERRGTRLGHAVSDFAFRRK